MFPAIDATEKPFYIPAKTVYEKWSSVLMVAFYDGFLYIIVAFTVS